MKLKTGRNLVENYQHSDVHTLIGIMSGTSFDGIDAVLVELHAPDLSSISRIDLKGSVSMPYSHDFKQQLMALCDPAIARIDALVYAHFALAEWYARAVQKLLELCGLPPEKIDALCLHGQTIWHAPIPLAMPGPDGLMEIKGTLQIGSAAVRYERTGIPVVHDFRSRDMAAGGEGAPLAPIVDAFLYGDASKGRIVQNIGGIGNATVIPAGANPSQIYAFDTGPGNMIIDELVRRKTNGRHQYDPDGIYAASGTVSAFLLDLLMQDPYFLTPPPKSTGREVYGSTFVDALLQKADGAHIGMDDLIATATAFTAESIVRSYRDFVFPRAEIHQVIVCGGGAYNKTLLRMIRERLTNSVSVHTSEDFGIPSSAREAIAFAVLGHLALMGQPGNIPAVTGARHPAVLGNLTL
ncbi:MAG: anhydro-N-acetylmuramic acid kinase [Rectinema sp.]|nr:anhydro-N-acetylmuramic acid kinase [Rectinema sp.]